MTYQKYFKNIFLFSLLFSVVLFSCKKSNNAKTEAEVVETKINEAPFFKLSLAQWSLNKTFNDEGVSPFEFARISDSLGFDALEYVSQLYKNQIVELGFDAVIDSLKKLSEKHGLKNNLIMVDDEGNLADLNEKVRNQAVENHKKWVDAAKYLGCHAIRVNAHGNGSYEDVGDAAVKGLTKLSEYAYNKGINILVENHGGFTSNGRWLADVMKKIGKSNCGTLPDFGNFCQTEDYGSINDENCNDTYDIYKGIHELMPYAKAVSAKSYDFDMNGNQPKIDYFKALQIVKDAGYSGFIGVEYEGNNLNEKEGILATKALLLKVAKEVK
jgi:sugar phosphate isomerase/epimerase